MKATKKIKIGVGVVLAVIMLLFFHYNLPRTAVVQISGTDTKRMDTGVNTKEKESTSNKNVTIHSSTTDVRFINTVSRKGKPIVFKNEDTGWGWPLYFKFDSADITAEAQAFATDTKKPWVLIKYYGWRVKILSMFPNALALKHVNHNYTHIPVFNIVFFVLLFILVFIIRRKLRKIFKKS